MRSFQVQKHPRPPNTGTPGTLRATDWGSSQPTCRRRLWSKTHDSGTKVWQRRGGSLHARTHFSQVGGVYCQSETVPSDRVFPLCYSTVWNLVTRLGIKLNVRISPHNLRRHSATYASRNGVPLEIISKVLLRHQDLKTTQIYLGKISDTEAIRWMDILHGK